MNSTLAFATCLLALAASGQAPTFSMQPQMPLQGGLTWIPNRNVVAIAERIGQLWEWDGARFHLRLATGQAGFSGIWDPDRRRMVASTGAIWDGANWSTMTMAGQGPIAYDARRHRLVQLLPRDVAEWDGMQWQVLRPPTASPDGPVVYDPIRQTCVALGGNPLTLWSWDGADWTLLHGNGPAAVARLTSIVFDPVNARLVVHGRQSTGIVPGTWAFANGSWSTIATPSTLNDGPAIQFDGVGMLRLAQWGPSHTVWRLEGTVWRRLPFEHPRARDHIALASSAASPDVLMFGGGPILNDPVSDQTWTWNGSWVHRSPAHSPPPRRSAGLAWSAVDQGFLLFGGIDPNGGVMVDTWLWNGSDWLPRSPANAPSVHVHLVADPSGGVLALLRDWNATVPSQWVWNGSDWVIGTGHGGPLGFYGLVNAGYDPRRNVVAAAVDYQLWEWDGAIWTRRGFHPSSPWLTVAWEPYTQRLLFVETTGYGWHQWDGAAWITRTVSRPYFTRTPTMVADYGRNRLFSVAHNANCSECLTVGDALMTDTPSAANRLGYGCGLHGAPGLATEGRPVPGNAGFGVAAATLAPNALSALVVGFTQQGQHLGGGCIAWLAVPTAVQVQLTDAVGQAMFGLPIPNLPQLSGAAVLSQVVVLDANNSPLGTLTVSEGLRLEIGN
ncbi:MAG: hypothetical protein IPK26_03145 [Planctomycetes bacterium]|nr:hypothetical protein [Planctomycetota bacterium]